MNLITCNDVANWFSSARPGDRLCYWRGFLACDRSQMRLLRCENGRTLTAEGHGEFCLAADRIWQMADDNLLILAQRRNGCCDYSYYAYKTAPRVRVAA